MTRGQGGSLDLSCAELSSAIYYRLCSRTKRPAVPPVLTPPKQSSLLFFNEDEQWPYQNSGSIISKPGTVAV